jgi:thiosulfate/3-mercaptopyruvate sulfurtransferase
MSHYAHPEALVTTGWAAAHVDHPAVRFVEVDVDTAAYQRGHIPGAVGWNWQTDLNDRVRRDLVSAEGFAELNRAAGIRPGDTVVFYGDNNNWFAAGALWQFKYYGHRDVRLLNGGRKKWELEGRPFDAGPARAAARSDYPVPTPDESVHRRAANLVDVRSPDEFSGKINAPPGLPETAQRSGHIPGARNVPWANAANDDGTFKAAAELSALYGTAGIDGARPTIAYCRIGERSSHTWFVLKYLLGLPDVRNYDGSWTEWGNAIGTPIELGVEVSAAGRPCVA